MKDINALGNLEIQSASACAQSTAINEVLRQEYSLFNLLMNLRFCDYQELTFYLEYHLSKFLHIFATLNASIQKQTPEPLYLQIVPVPTQANEKDLLQALRAGEEIQNYIKRLIAIDALFKTQPEWEEFMVSLVEFHEETCAVIERSLLQEVDPAPIKQEV